ncbi:MULTISPECIES: hypothetical protein [Rhodanobacter]|uniref:hypothetical protein n=1 Tax=Rhodanobacter TaxID=75309 RepID=UPI00121412C8|nr:MULTISPECIES: hypothetical protein [Rhodanobacter]TAN17794.1 MAG: hypothetical protein EPN35_06080 [Rhodanobacter sp.]UJJ54799.1 hypothetical protein LRK53_17985 [Rhodanobacter thiooxydans]
MDANQFVVRAGDGMDAGVEATQERLPDARKARKRGAPLFGYFLSGKRKKVTRAPKAHESSWLCFKQRNRWRK